MSLAEWSFCEHGFGFPENTKLVPLGPWTLYWLSEFPIAVTEKQKTKIERENRNKLFENTG